ncbi:MAG: pyridoxal-phosphate dependent enzyme [Crocinitomicaceae bacterium]
MNLPSPIQKLASAFLDEHGINLLVKRDDLIHPEISGNKWRKLKLWIEKFHQGKYDALLTFGGAYSNHIAATAAMGALEKIPVIGVIRGDELNQNANPTLQNAAKNGMRLVFSSREEYDLKEEKYFQEELRRRYGNVLIIPEGGFGYYGMLGCTEILSEIKDQVNAIFLPMGTGTTLAGVLFGSETETIYGVSALKGGDFLNKNVEFLLSQAGLDKEDINEETKRLQVLTDYHFGGYAKHTPELIEFMKDFKSVYKLNLDYIYTAKMMFGLFELIKANHFEKGTTILAIHTGGLQGNSSIEDLILM